jgi:hypothetical protein
LDLLSGDAVAAAHVRRALHADSFNPAAVRRFCMPCSALQKQFYRWGNAGPGDKATPARAGTTFSRHGAAPAGLIFRSGL